MPESTTSVELSGAPLRVLTDSLGYLRTLRVIAGVAKRHVLERPFKSLGPAQNKRERLSRQQALGAILLYRELKSQCPEQALDVVFRVVEAGAVGHLRKTLGHLRGDALARLDNESRRSRVQGWIDRFFTATAQLGLITEKSVEFTVTACALVRLSRTAGHPELAPAFCRGDASYFASLSPPIRLERRTTIAQGGDHCPFVLSLLDETS